MKQHGNILIIIIVIATIFIALIFLLLKSLEQPNQTNNPQILELKKQVESLQTQLENSKEKIDHFYSSSITCSKNTDPNNDIGIWELLPDNIKNKTYKKDLVPAGSATYEIDLLEWSKDCDKLIFLLELVGRDGEAYSDNDFKPRGVYLFDEKLKRIRTIKTFSKNSYLPSHDYLANYWTTSGTYIFEEVTNNQNGGFVGTKYEYSPVSNQINTYNDF